MKKWTKIGVVLGGLWGLISSLLTLEKHFTCAFVRDMNLFQYFLKSNFSLIEKIVFFPAFLANKYSCWGWTLIVVIYIFYSILIGMLIGITFAYSYNKYRGNIK